MLNDISVSLSVELTDGRTATAALPDSGLEARAALLPRYRILVMVAIGLIGLAFDQATKVWAFASELADAAPLEVVPGFFAPFPARNYGAVAHLAGVHSMTATLCALNGLVMLGAAAWWGCRRIERWRSCDAIFIGLVFAGMVGNSIDRLTLGYVRDFLVTTVCPALIFNLADVFILVGFLLLLGSWSVSRLGRLRTEGQGELSEQGRVLPIDAITS